MNNQAIIEAVNEALKKAGNKASTYIKDRTSTESSKVYRELTWTSESLPEMKAAQKIAHETVTALEMARGSTIDKMSRITSGKKYYIWNLYFHGHNYVQGSWKCYQAGLTWEVAT